MRTQDIRSPSGIAMWSLQFLLAQMETELGASPRSAMGPTICISNKLPGEMNTAGPGTTL